jgi:Ca2+-binding RTX toxin-like protein
MTPATSTGKKGSSLVERLEFRRLFNASVIQTYPGFYQINADAQTTAINVSVDQNAETFTLDGTTYSNVQHIVINGNDQGDTITVNSNDEYGYIGADVNGGAGNDTINLNELSGVIHGGGGQDTLTLRDSWFGEVYGDTGSDSIYVIGDSYGAQVVAGTGNTLIDASQSNYGLSLYGGPGNDTIYGSNYDDQIYGGGGNDYLYGLGGNDTFYSTGGVVVGSCNGTNTVYEPTGAYVTCYNCQFIYSY